MGKIATKKLLAEQHFLQFEEIGINKEASVRIINRMFAKGLAAEDMGWVLECLSEYLENKQEAEMMNNATTADIDAVLDECVMMKKNQMEDMGGGSGDKVEMNEHPLQVWMFEELNTAGRTFAAGDKIRIQIMRTGSWKHQEYGDVVVTEKTIDNVVQNFNNRARGIDLAVDENHEPDHKALGWIKQLYKEGTKALFAVIELTALGAKTLSEGAYKYFSPEIAFRKKDEESGQEIRDLLVGGAFTNRPFFKAMTPMMASETNTGRRTEINGGESGNPVFLFNHFTDNMKTIVQIIADATAKDKIEKKDIANIKFAFAEITDKDERKQLKHVIDSVYKSFDEQGDEKAADVEAEKPVEETPADPTPGTDPAPTEEKPADEPAPTDPETPADPAPADGEGAPAPETNVEATEKDVTIKASELAQLKDAQKQLAQYIRNARIRELDDQVKTLVFNETNKSGVILPKQQKALVDLCASLSEVQAKAVLGMFKEINSTFSTLTKEYGADAGLFAEEAESYGEAYKSFKAQGLTDEAAKNAAKEFCNLKKQK